MALNDEQLDYAEWITENEMDHSPELRKEFSETYNNYPIDHNEKNETQLDQDVNEFEEVINLEDKKLIATKLGFESVEEMEAYHELCRGYFYEDAVLTKELCSEFIIDNDWEDLVSMPREDRLEKKLFLDFGGLIESMRFDPDETEKNFRDLIEFELEELRTCHFARYEKEEKSKNM